MEALLVSSSVLILFVILLRAVFGRRISFRMRYALWLVVVLRLAWPFAVPGSSASVMNYVPFVQAFFAHGTESSDSSEPAGARADGGLAAGGKEHGKDTEDLLTGETGEPILLTVRQGDALVLSGDGSGGTARRIPFGMIWLAGSVIMGLYLLTVNIRFYRRLCRTRVLISPGGRTKAGRKLPVYRCGRLAAPCLFGVWHPAVYLNDTALADEKHRAFVLAHEQQHVRHRDHIWSLVRLVCLTVYWFHPFVWAAAVLSTRDCELACDEGVTARIADEDCAEYGRSLLRQVPLKHGELRLTATTSMSGSARALKRRLLAIKYKKKPSLWAALLTAVMLLLVTGCTFTGADERRPETENNGAGSLAGEDSGNENAADGAGGSAVDGNDADGTGGSADGTGTDGAGAGASGSGTDGAGDSADGNGADENLMQTALRAFTMFSDGRHGWALTEDYRLLYTKEGIDGFTYLNALPFVQAGTASDSPDMPAGFLAGVDSEVSVCFLDEKTAYFAGVSADSGEALIIRETIMEESAAGDGNGRILVSEHRTRVLLQEYFPNGNMYVSFADAEHGYLLVCSDPAAGLMTKHLYRTTDGGDSFSFMTDVSVSSEISGYPTGMAFCSEDIGYIGISTRGEADYLYGTTDGGETWESVDVPVHADAYYSDSLAPVVFDEEGVPMMALVLRNAVGQSDRYVLYENPTPGDFITWQLIHILPYDEIRSYYFVDRNTGYFIDGDGMLQKWEYGQ